MDAAIKAKWIEALRSGKYEQGRQRLCADGKFCCLGVLQVVVADAGTLIETYEGGELLDVTDARTQLGLDYEAQDSLAAMNDGGKTFAEIADYIEKAL